MNSIQGKILREIWKHWGKGGSTGGKVGVLGKYRLNGGKLGSMG